MLPTFTKCIKMTNICLLDASSDTFYYGGQLLILPFHKHTTEISITGTKCLETDNLLY